MRRRREESEGGSISFLDVIACAFGAIILLVLVLPVGDFGDREELPDAAQYGRLLFALGGLEEAAAALARQLAENAELAKRLDADLAQAAHAERYLETLIADTREQSRRMRQRSAALAESSRILRERPPEAQDAMDLETELAGIPVDSEYVAFVVDTSPSMQQIWEEVMEEIANVLSLYPQLRGFQILNDQGFYLYPAKQGRWIADSPASRRAALDRMEHWAPHSPSNPARGILTALNDLYDRERKMAIFVFGDDYQEAGFFAIRNDHQETDFDGFLDRVERGARSQGVGAGTLRIHAIGFSSCLALVPISFAVLMRELTRRHQGAFLALPHQESAWHPCSRQDLVIKRENGLPEALPRRFG